MTKLAAMLAGVALATLAQPALAADRALVIGINAYPGILVGGVAHQRDLFGAVNDARRMAGVMTDAFGIAPEDVLVLTDERASRAGILEAFRRHLIDGTRPGDRVFFYFAGHGIQLADMDTDEGDDGLDEALVPSDATVDLAVRGDGFRGAILDDELQALISRLAGRSVTVIVDACHSGTITRAALDAGRMAAPGGYSPVRTLSPHGPLRLAGAAGAPTVEERLAHRRATRLDLLPKRSADGPRDLAVWTAVSSAQYALEDMSVGGSAGLFTGLFAKGLGDGAADLNGNGAITAAEVLTFLRDGTRAYCASWDCLGQDPLPTLEAPPGYDGAVLRRLDEPALAGAGESAPAGLVLSEPRLDMVAAISSDLVPGSAVARASVTLTGGATVTVGAPLRLAIRSEVAGRLVVLDRREGGETVQLFPNNFELGGQSEGLIAAGETRSLPGDGAGYELVADAPGRGTIVALVVDPALPLDQILADNGRLAPIAAADDYAAELAAVVNRAIVFPEDAGLDGEAALAAPATATAPSTRAEAGYTIVE